MAIRLPLKNVALFTDAGEEGVGSVGQGVPHTFVIPQDTDNVVVKFTASVEGAYSALLQTTDDGGTTWFDVARTSIVSNATGNKAEWLSTPVCGFGYSTTVISPSVVAVGSVVTRGSVLSTIGQASSLGQRAYSGMPILSQQGRVLLIITGDAADVAYNTATITVMVNSQSATA